MSEPGAASGRANARAALLGNPSDGYGGGGRSRATGGLLTRNFELRRSLFEPRHVRLVELAGELGAPANYAGSGGAIVGILPEGSAVAALRDAFAAEGCDAIAPTLTAPST